MKVFISHSRIHCVNFLYDTTLFLLSFFIHFVLFCYDTVTNYIGLSSPKLTRGQVLELLRVAWKRKLTFTIGTSVTSGITDTVVWNEIHHKTDPNSNHHGHGYPDTNYLDRVLLELAAQGVEDTQEEEELQESSEEES